MNNVKFLRVPWFLICLSILYGQIFAILGQNEAEGTVTSVSNDTLPDFSVHRCVDHYHGIGYRVCHFSLVCLDHQGRFLYFQPPDEKISSTFSWDYHKIQDFEKPTTPYHIGRRSKHPPRKYVTLQGRFYMDENHSLMERGVWSPVLFPGSLPKGVVSRWVTKPTFLMKRLAAGNAGHMLTETLIPTFVQMYYFDFLNDNSLFLLLDKCDGEWNAEFYPPHLCERFTSEFFNLLSSTPSATLDSYLPDEGSLTCFRDAVVGHGAQGYLLHSQSGRGAIPKLLRNHVLKKFEVSQPNCESFKVVIHKKNLVNKHGAQIGNPDAVAEFLAKELTHFEGIPVQVWVLTLDHLSVLDQVRLFANVDVYISDQGSASYISLFMPDSSSIIYVPPCNICYDGSCDSKDCPPLPEGTRAHEMMSRKHQASLWDQIIGKTKRFYFCCDPALVLVQSSFPHLNVMMYEPQPEDLHDTTPTTPPLDLNFDLVLEYVLEALTVRRRMGCPAKP